MTLTGSARADGPSETQLASWQNNAVDYALQCGIWQVSRLHGPQHRDGIVNVESQSAETAQVGDLIFTPPAKKYLTQAMDDYV